MFSSHFERTSDAVFIVEWKTRRILSCNDAVKDLFGYNPEELIGNTAQSLYPSDEDYRIFSELCTPVLTRLETFRHQFRMRHRDGTVFRSQHLVSPIDNGRGMLEDVLAIVRDVDNYDESHTLAELTTEYSPIALVLTALDSGRVLQANQACLALFGVGPEEDISRYAEQDFYVDPTLRRTIINRLLKEKRITDMEIEFRRRDGSRFWATLHASLVSHKTEPALLSGLVEVTDRKKALEAAIANEARYRDLTEMTADWFWETDLEGRFTSFLQTGVLDGMDMEKDWTGKSRKSFSRALGSVPNITDAVQPFMDRGEAFEGMRFHFMHPERGEVWMTVSGKPIRGADGRLVGYRGMARNVTLEVSQMREIENKEQLLRSIIDNAPATIYLKDLEGRYLLANQRLTEIAARQNKDIIGHTSADIFESRAARNFIEQDREVARTATPHSYEQASAAPGMENHILQITKFPAFDRQGKVVAVGGINLDITERYRLENELEQLRRLETIGQLTGGVAHDFNNLLSVIISNAEFLEETPASDAARKAVQAIIAAADRGANLTRELLAFSRKQRLEVTSCDPKVIAERLSTLLQRTIPAGIDLEISAEDDVQPVLVDSRKLENAVINLVVNSRDALGRQGHIGVSMANIDLPTSDAALRLGLEPGRYLLVQVEDDGPGIPEDIREKVLEPYFTTKEPGKGTGLGLSSALGFARQSGGNLLIGSGPGKGAQVSIYLPRAQEPDRVLPDEGEGEDIHPMPGPPARILVVEDERLVRASACLLLRQLQYQVVEAENAEQALAILKRDKEPFDLLFSDIIMPGSLDGLALANEASRLFPKMHILLTSGYSERRDLDAIGSEKAFQVLEKPYRKSDLLLAIRKALKRKVRLVG